VAACQWDLEDLEFRTRARRPFNDDGVARIAGRIAVVWVCPGTVEAHLKDKAYGPELGTVVKHDAVTL
jgi:hypothetical protein